MYQMVCAIGSIDKLTRQHLRQIDRGACAQQAVIVVDEVRVAVIDALVVWHMRVRRMDAHALCDDLVQRTAGTHQIVIDLAGADLITRHHPLLQFGVECLLASIRRTRHLHVHLSSSGNSLRHPTLDRTVPTTMVAAATGGRSIMADTHWNISTSPERAQQGYAGDGGPATRGAAEQSVRSCIRSSGKSVLFRYVQSLHPPRRCAHRRHHDDRRHWRTAASPATAARRRRRG